MVKTAGVHVLEDEILRIHDVLPTHKVRKPPAHLAEGDDDDFAPLVIEDVSILGAEPEPGEDEFEEDVPEAPMNAQVLQQAHAEAEALLAEAMQQAEHKAASLMAEAQREAEELRQQAQLNGRAEGYAEAARTIEALTAGLEDTVARMEGDKAGFEAEYEDTLQWAAMEIASRVLAKKVERNDAELTEMVHKAVQDVKNETWVRVEVAQEMTRLIVRLTDLLDSMENVEVSPIPAPAGTVLIETPSGVVDASLKTQLENLKSYFQKVQE